MMTKKDFIALANAIRDHDSIAAICPSRKQIFTFDQLDTLAALCASQNPRFDRARWLGYIRGVCGPNGGTVKGGA